MPSWRDASHRWRPAIASCGAAATPSRTGVNAGPRGVEIVAFQRNAVRRFTPSMRRRIDLARLYRDAADQVEAGQERRDEPLGLPADCQFTLDQLLTDSWERLEVVARVAGPG